MQLGAAVPAARVPPRDGERFPTSFTSRRDGMQPPVPNERTPEKLAWRIGPTETRTTSFRPATKPGYWRSIAAAEFLRLHPQRDWQEGCLGSRPPQRWTLFEADRSRG
ncbi:MAG: hypothetical protein AVDCRST_MAG59-94 [uncultured Thermomicrobiales bacterium]|uniref:Uncharacterized protein n=1 Tax=uncultured Thermomicrobiales bacterium TaxID=1645740 RepID=A0A6J4TW99_9BACT|nr:MAG: hypothetical protein AVDCRST_MAG59-94 [uncultured Thermomicrobiales bacterium]